MSCAYKIYVVSSFYIFIFIGFGDNYQVSELTIKFNYFYENALFYVHYRWFKLLNTMYPCLHSILFNNIWLFINQSKHCHTVLYYDITFILYNNSI